jgi:hypothetical protein
MTLARPRFGLLQRLRELQDESSRDVTSMQILHAKRLQACVRLLERSALLKKRADGGSL